MQCAWSGNLGRRKCETSLEVKRKQLELDDQLKYRYQTETSERKESRAMATLISGRKNAMTQ